MKDKMALIRRWVATQLIQEADNCSMTPLEVVNLTACRKRFLGRLRLEREVGEELLTSALGLAQAILRRKEMARKEMARETAPYNEMSYLPEGWEVEADKCRVQPCKCLDEIEASYR